MAAVGTNAVLVVLPAITLNRITSAPVAAVVARTTVRTVRSMPAAVSTNVASAARRAMWPRAIRSHPHAAVVVPTIAPIARSSRGLGLSGPDDRPNGLVSVLGSRGADVGVPSATVLRVESQPGADVVFARITAAPRSCWTPIVAVGALEAEHARFPATAGAKPIAAAGAFGKVLAGAHEDGRTLPRYAKSVAPFGEFRILGELDFVSGDQQPRRRLLSERDEYSATSAGGNAEGGDIVEQVIRTRFGIVLLACGHNRIQGKLFVMRELIGPAHRVVAKLVGRQLQDKGPPAAIGYHVAVDVKRRLAPGAIGVDLVDPGQQVRVFLVKRLAGDGRFFVAYGIATVAAFQVPVIALFAVFHIVVAAAGH